MSSTAAFLKSNKYDSLLARVSFAAQNSNENASDFMNRPGKNYRRKGNQHGMPDGQLLRLSAGFHVNVSDNGLHSHIAVFLLSSAIRARSLSQFIEIFTAKCRAARKYTQTHASRVI